MAYLWLLHNSEKRSLHRFPAMRERTKFHDRFALFRTKLKCKFMEVLKLAFPSLQTMLEAQSVSSHRTFPFCCSVMALISCQDPTSFAHKNPREIMQVFIMFRHSSSEVPWRQEKLHAHRVSTDLLISAVQLRHQQSAVSQLCKSTRRVLIFVRQLVKRLLF